MTTLKLAHRGIANRFWADVMNITYYTINNVYIHSSTMRTPYEIWNGKAPNLDYFHVFGSKRYILNDRV